MKILIDLDSTITNFGEVLLAELNKENGTNYAYHEIDSWLWFDENFFDPWGPIRYAGFWDKVKPYPEAIGVIKRLIDEGHEVFVVTASFFIPSLSKKINTSIDWFHNYQYINPNNIIITQRKDMINGDVLIDDGLHNCKAFPGKVVLYNQPWNQSPDWTLRAHNWNEVWDILHSPVFNK